MQKTFAGIYSQHIKRISNIEHKGYNVIEIWECQFDNMMETNIDLKNFVHHKCHISTPIRPRDCFYGGRTEALCEITIADLEKDEKIQYVDFTSLYPYVQKYKKFPIGHPQIITEFESNDISNYFGLIKCEIVPPQKLFIPVLPYNCNKRLLFPLCRECAHNLYKYCNHTNDDDRKLTNVWTSIEIQKAINKGYRIVKIYEVWHYPCTSEYDFDTKTGGLFTDYVNTFLKMKQEASGYPSNVVTEQDKDEYIQQYYENEGVLLDKDNISSNPGMRAVAKLLLNSHWGRFAMNTHKSKTVFIKEYEEWCALLSNQNYKIMNNLLFEDDDIMMVTYIEDENITDNNFSNNQLNIVIAAFVTAHARLTLYDNLERLDDRVIYYDTDSIIYKVKPGEYEPKLGNYLGELTNELTDEQQFITKILAPGPKNYIFETKNGERKSVIKGFSLNQQTKDLINMDTVNDLIINNRNGIISVPQKEFKRINYSSDVTVKDIIKSYKMPQVTKRINLDNNRSIPYGFIQ